MESVLELTKQALMLTLILSGPPIAAAAIVGLVVAFLQAATQLQEQTFAYALKFVAIVLALLATGALIGGTLYTYADRIVSDFPVLIRRSRAMPPASRHACDHLPCEGRKRLSKVRRAGHRVTLSFFPCSKRHWTPAFAGVTDRGIDAERRASCAGGVRRGFGAIHR